MSDLPVIVDTADGVMTITKEVIDKAQDWTTDVMFAHQSELIEPVFSSEDAIEGATAFAEKRAPVWKGR